MQEPAEEDEPLSEETLQAIGQSLKEYRDGMYYTHEEILADLGEKSKKTDTDDR